MPPDIYPYTFNVDGTSLPDSGNPLVKPIVMGGNQSLVHVPGGDALRLEVRDYPAGTLHHHFYKSAIAGEGRDFYVYTSPGYDPAGQEEYPVLYLLHGITDDASAWTNAGRDVILDNLIARGKAKPMLVVMPLGYAFPDIPRNIYNQLREPSASRQALEKFSATVLDELIPQVEKAYRVAKGRDSRAIAGLSMGGAPVAPYRPEPPGSLRLGRLLQRWCRPLRRRLRRLLPRAVDGGASRPRLVWLACGTEDFLIQPHRKFTSWLKEKGVEFTSKETSGAHTWMVCAATLTDLLPLLFRDAKS